MYNIAKYAQKTLYNKSIDNTQKSMYNIITVKGREATKKGGGAHEVPGMAKAHQRAKAESL